jgi:flagella synthesis protein FlgN
MIRSHIEREIVITNDLVAILKLEQECLIKADLPGLDSLITRKESLLLDLNQAAKARREIVAQSGRGNDRQDVVEFIMNTPADNRMETLAAWQTLLREAERAKELNRVNGVLIHRHSSVVRQRLNTLRGTDTTTYESSGKSSALARSRTLVVG